MPRLTICSRNLHWQWINRTLLCDTMEVSMLRLAWLTVAQQVFQPAFTGRLELISQKKLSPLNVNKCSHGEQILWKIASCELGPRSYRDLMKKSRSLVPCTHDITSGIWWKIQHVYSRINIHILVSLFVFVFIFAIACIRGTPYIKTQIHMVYANPNSKNPWTKITLVAVHGIPSSPDGIVSLL